MSNFLDWISVWFGGTPILDNIINAITIVWLLIISGIWIRDRFTFKTVTLSIGTFKIARKDFNVQSVTNIVSLIYYDGGQVPGHIRKEILNITNPSIKGLVINSKKK
ncbi:hypothetical protein [Sodaliphilus sp.]|uniref:hypothetical protein n=1 Tax=Sodaliphilus sp. TaxID=2815818 RepID=UPI00388DB79D